MVNPHVLPPDLPAPEDDGACDHLKGVRLPELALPATTGEDLDVCSENAAFTVLYAYPMTGRPGASLPEGWLQIPGAFGCTIESCTYCDSLDEFRQLDTDIRGVSSQTTAEQREFSDRERIPYPLLSDGELRFTQALRLPTLQADGVQRIRRLTLVVGSDREVVQVYYPIADPSNNATEVLAFLSGLG